MAQDYDEFERAAKGCEAVFKAWTDNYKDFVAMSRDPNRRKEDFRPSQVTLEHTKIQQRLEQIRTFRKQHEQLTMTVTRVMKSFDHETISSIEAEEGGEDKEEMTFDTIDVTKEVEQAYSPLRTLDVLDISPEGTNLWVEAEARYNEKIARVETQIISHLRDKLATCRNANEMFRVFSQFNALLVRPKIFGAIQEYQTKLIGMVKEDISRLQEKFTIKYKNSEAATMSRIRDIPEVSGTIIWARQIERQLKMYIDRIEKVFNKGLDTDSQKFLSESKTFQQRLDMEPIFKQWCVDIEARDLKISGPIFSINQIRAQGNKLQLSINFNDQIISLFKEVRNLSWLGFSVPVKISQVAKEGKKIYPYAISLMETIRMYNLTCQKVEASDQGSRDQARVSSLIAGYRKEVQEKISQGMSLRWDTLFLDSKQSEKLTGYVRELANIVSIFQDKADELLVKTQEINQRLIQ